MKRAAATPIVQRDPFLSFFGTFPIFLRFSRVAQRGGPWIGADRVVFLLGGLLRAPTRNSPESVHDTICDIS